MRLAATFRMVLLAFLVAFGSSTVGLAQTIHVLIAAIDDEKIGCAIDVQNIDNVFRSCVAPNHLDMQVLWGNGFSKENIFDKIAAMSVDPSDAIVFFWAGHGAHDENGHYLAKRDGVVVYRSDVLAAMEKKNPRLKVLLTNGCNTLVESGQAPVFRKAAIAGGMTELFAELFLKSAGTVDVNTASENECGFASPQSGSIFFRVLCSRLRLNARNRCSWPGIMKDVASEVQREFHDTVLNQYPNGYPQEDGTMQTTLTLRYFLPLPGERRTVWAHNGGSFKNTEGTTWIETGKDMRVVFKEVTRNANFIEMYDETRQMSVRLDDMRMYWRTPDQPQWNLLHDGRWSAGW